MQFWAQQPPCSLELKFIKMETDLSLHPSLSSLGLLSNFIHRLHTYRGIWHVSISKGITNRFPWQFLSHTDVEEVSGSELHLRMESIKVCSPSASPEMRGYPSTLSAVPGISNEMELEALDKPPEYSSSISFIAFHCNNNNNRSKRKYLICD